MRISDWSSDVCSSDLDARAVVVHALLDSPSAAGAFRFAIDPGEETVFDVDMRLYPRVDLAHAGIAPLTSMFEFDPKIGRASCRERVCQYVKISVVAV